MSYRGVTEEFVVNDKPRRVPIQLSSTYHISRDTYLLFALCNDGTMWSKFPDNIWTRIQDIPQN